MLLSAPQDPIFARQIFLFKNGDASNKEEIIELVHSLRNSARVHTRGIGKYAHSDLMLKIAQAGHGIATMIDEAEDIESKVLSMFQRTLVPYQVLTQIKLLDYSKEEIHTIENVAKLYHYINLNFFYLKDTYLSEARFVEMTILNPLNSEANTHTIEILPTQNQASIKLVAQAKVLRLPITCEERPHLAK